MITATPRRREPAVLAAATLAVGLGAGLGAVLFRELIVAVTRLLTGTDDYAATPGAPLPWLPGAGSWFLVVVPVLGGLVYGPLVYRYAREARGHGVPEVMLAVAEHGGRIRPRVAVVKALASAVCIGSGGSVGREGPIVQIGSALGSGVGQWLRMPTRRLRLLVACGAAGGISATFNAPVAGVFFALEILLLDVSLVSFVVVATSSVVANTVARVAEGADTFLALPRYTVGSVWELPAFVVVGLVGGLVGVAFTRVLYGAEDVVDRIWRGPEWLRPAVGGVVLGLLLVALPQMYGVGYPVLEQAVTGGYAVAFLLVLLVGKLVATSLTLAIGGSGGVFAPALFLGAMTGSVLGAGTDALGVGTAGAVALVGTAAVLAGSTRAPVTAVVIVAEITAEWALVLPLMIAVAVATVVSRLLATETVYTEKLARRGIRLRAPGTPRWARRTVGDSLGPPEADPAGPPALGGAEESLGPVRWSEVLDAGHDLGGALDVLERTGSATLPVLAADGSRLLGLVAAADLVGTPADDRGDRAHEPDARCVVELVEDPPEGWTPPPGFRRLEGPDGVHLLLGPCAGLDTLVAGLATPPDETTDATSDPT
ncbi:chloride channel protein [Actinomycetospora sp. CA-053990]|uniref:chloride channel protein n=1 Tax=Actinomycetospora sp. CA-053990 TaxID=3239891 RepID=UPI003D91A125